MNYKKDIIRELRTLDFRLDNILHDFVCNIKMIIPCYLIIRQISLNNFLPAVLN